MEYYSLIGNCKRGMSIEIVFCKIFTKTSFGQTRVKVQQKSRFFEQDTSFKKGMTNIFQKVVVVEGNPD